LYANSCIRKYLKNKLFFQLLSRWSLVQRFLRPKEINNRFCPDCTQFETVDWCLINEAILTRENTSFKGVGPAQGMNIIATLFDRNYHVKSQTILSTTTQLQMMTCFMILTLSFELYIKPFDQIIWICLLRTFSVMIALIHVLVLYKRLDIKEHFSAVIYVLSSFLDDGIKISTKMAKSTAFKLCTSGWLLTVVIFINCYNALVTTSLSSPSSGTKLESQKQIACGEDQRNRSIENVRRSIHNLFWFWYEQPIMECKNKILCIIQT